MASTTVNTSLTNAPAVKQPAAATQRARGALTAGLALRGMLSCAAWTESMGRAFVAQQALRERLRLVLVGTFYHENWIRAHLLPLVRCGAVESIDVVGAGSLPPMERVTYHGDSQDNKPSARIRRRWSQLRQVVRRVRPDAVIGYHIMPNALLALMAARWSGARAIYQMTGGPVQLIGGGFQSENPLLARLGCPSPALERRMFNLARRFDAIIVRGGEAQRFIRENRLNTCCAAIPGAVEISQHAETAPKSYDLICVGRLVSVKRVDRALRIVAALRRTQPTLRVAIVGDGPLSESLHNLAQSLNIENCVAFLGKRNDVADLLATSRAFLLTSDNEGLSIAALEAMACGLPLIAPRVGDMSVVLEDSVTGAAINADDADGAARRIDELLRDEGRRSAVGAAAREHVRRTCGVEHVSSLWEELFDRMQSRPRGEAPR